MITVRCNQKLYFCMLNTKYYSHIEIKKKLIIAFCTYKIYLQDDVNYKVDFVRLLLNYNV